MVGFSRCFFGKDGLFLVSKVAFKSKDVVKIKIESLNQFLSESIHPPSRARLHNANGVVFGMFWEWSREQCRKKTLATWKTI